MTWWLSISIAAPLLTAGQGHSCALSEGALSCWGGTTATQARTGVGSPRRLPQTVDGRWRAVSAGGNGRTCAVDDTGGVWCWGLESAPEAVPGLLADDVSVGLAHACARQGDAVWCWGNNRFGQLGDGTVEERSAPVKVAIDNVRSLDAGDMHTCALRTDGSVWCWGANGQGQLGTGAMTEAGPVPSPVLWLQDAVEVSAGGFYSCVRRVEGGAACWGDNLDGQLGNNSRTASPSPVAVKGVSGLVDLSAGYGHACGARGDGRLWCWGASQSGQIGSDEGTDHLLPGLVRDLVDVRSLSAGQQHTCLVRDSGLACMGDNFSSQLGDGSREGGHLPRPVGLQANTARVPK